MGNLPVFLLTGWFPIAVFVVAIATSFMARSALAKGNLRKGRALAIATFCAASFIAASNLILLVITTSAMAGIMAALWAWIAWRDYALVKSLPSSRK